MSAQLVAQFVGTRERSTHLEIGILVLVVGRGGSLIETGLLERLFGAVVQRRLSTTASGDDVGRVDLSKVVVVLVERLIELECEKSASCSAPMTA